MEGQELFNTMMENAIVYLQEKGYLAKPQTQQQSEGPKDLSTEEQTEILIRAGLLPRKK